MATNVILMGEGGGINPARVILVASMKSAPVKRFVKHTDPGKVINMTYGYPQRSIVVMDTGTVIITCYDVYELTHAIRQGKEVDRDAIPF